MPVYKGKEIEKTIQSPLISSKRLCLSFAFADVGSAGTHRGKRKGTLSLRYPNVQGDYLTAKSHGIAFFQSRVTKTITALDARDGDA